MRSLSAADLSSRIDNVSGNQGCTRGQHSAEKKAPVQPAPSPNVPAAPATTSQASSTKPAVETYGTPSQPPAPTVATKTPSAKVDWSKNEVVDDANAPVAGKSKCKRRGCGHEWPGQDGAPRGSLGPVDETEGCVYHPGIVGWTEMIHCPAALMNSTTLAS